MEHIPKPYPTKDKPATNSTHKVYVKEHITIGDMHLELIVRRNDEGLLDKLLHRKVYKFADGSLVNEVTGVEITLEGKNYAEVTYRGIKKKKKIPFKLP